MIRAGESIRYPVGCTSAFCGRSACGGCRSLPILEEFRRARDVTAARQVDPIWLPNSYVATRDEVTS